MKDGSKSAASTTVDRAGRPYEVRIVEEDGVAVAVPAETIEPLTDEIVSVTIDRARAGDDG